MTKPNKTYFLLSFILFILFIRIAFSTEQVVIEFLYWDPSKDPRYCPTCDLWIVAYEDFIERNNTMNRIQGNFTSKVLVNWTEYYSDYGREMLRSYNITHQNSIIIRDGQGNFTVIEGTFNETYIREVIYAYLEETPPPPPPPPPPPLSLMYVLAGAFSFGFFETFSPCLLILLSFVLSYSIGETTRFKEGFSKVMTFGIGFIFATVFVFLASVGLVVASSMLAFENVLMWVVFAIAIFFGLDLLGLSVLKFLRLEVKTKSTIQKLSRKFAFTYIGLIMLGFLFYFLDPCIAPIFVVMFGTFQQALLSFLPLVLFVFCIGVLLPFICIGILAGSISKLARGAYRHRSRIRAVSGIILIAYALYFIIIYIT